MRVAVLGATGFTGETLVDVLLRHPAVEVTCLCSRTETAVAYADLFPRFQGRTELLCEPLSLEAVVDKADVFFLSLPHTVSIQYVPFLLERGKYVIDLSADYRLKNKEIYKQYYKTEHTDTLNLKHAVYGLTELYRDAIRTARLVANAGCYPSAMILALYPLLHEQCIENVITVDAKSSITGAGRKASVDMHYTNVTDNIWAYRPYVHQHTPEVVQVLEERTSQPVDIRFVPQVIGVEAGIYMTIHVALKKGVSHQTIAQAYERCYQGEPFVRIHKKLPQLKDVARTNFCDLGWAVDEHRGCGVIVACVDNLMKGAASGAVQNMNCMLGFDETLGLI